MKYAIVSIVFILAALLLMFACGEGDGVNFDPSTGALTGQATLPLLPLSLPVFPTEVNLDGLTDSFMDFVGDYDPFGLVSSGDVDEALSQVEKKLEQASLQILQPGVLSISIDNVITDAIRDNVKVTGVKVNFKFTNKTDVWVDVPVEFQLFLGDGDKAKQWDPSVMIPFVDDRVNPDGTFIVKPGETVEMSTDNIQQLVDALNNSDSIGVGYKAKYRMADVANGARIDKVVSHFGLCVVALILGIGDTSSCPSIEELLNWHLSFDKFELVINAESDIDIPDIPMCSEFADNFGLDDLKQACED